MSKAKATLWTVTDQRGELHVFASTDYKFDVVDYMLIFDHRETKTKCSFPVDTVTMMVSKEYEDG